MTSACTSPGDDLRQVDWNAVARTGEIILRVRQDEVSPRVEVLVDASRSMALSPAKEARAREVALLAVEVGGAAGTDAHAADHERAAGAGAGAGVPLGAAGVGVRREG